MLKDRDIFTRLIRSRPLFTASVLFLTGALLEYALDLPVFIAVAASVLCIGAAILLRENRRLFALMLLTAFLPFGMIRFSISWDSIKTVEEKPKADLVGRICELPIYKEDTERTVCILDDVMIDGRNEPSRLRLYLRGDTELLCSVGLGQTVSCTAHLWAPGTATNPCSFDFAQYLRIDGIAGYATAKIEDCVFDPPSIRITDYPLLLRKRIAERIDCMFGEHAPIAKALLIGDRNDLDDDIRTAFSRAGIAHILAISGMHITFIAMCISFLLRSLFGRKTAFAVTLIILILYGTVIGFPTAFIRALITYSVFSAAPIFGRHSDGPTRLGLAILIHLMLIPRDLISAGFVLSYGASAGITLLNEPLQELFHVRDYLHRPIPGGIRGFCTVRIPMYVLSACVMTLSAQIATLPAVVHFFGTQPLLSLLSNIIVVPIIMAGYVFAGLAILTGLTLFSKCACGIFSLIRGMVSALSELPVTDIRIARFPVWLVLALVLILVCATSLSTIPKKIRKYLPLAIIPAILISNLSAQIRASGCKLMFMDAGQADCAMLQIDGKTYLFDTGDAYTPAADYLSAGNYGVEAIFLSHPHSDHSGGLASILDVCTPKTIYISENWSCYEADEGIQESIDRAVLCGSRIVPVSKGYEIEIAPNTQVSVLSPIAGNPAASANDDSLLLKLSYGHCTALIGGDLSAAHMPDDLPDIDILKVSHHGSSDSLSERVLSETTPSLAIISVGYNTYGHPTESTHSLLDRSECRFLRTDICGMITCRLHKDGTFDVTHYLNSSNASGNTQESQEEA